MAKDTITTKQVLKMLEEYGARGERVPLPSLKRKKKAQRKLNRLKRMREERKVKGFKRIDQKITEEQAKEIKYGTETNTFYAKKFNLSIPYVGKIKKGDMWSSI